ncbi:MAG: hypothetical protein Q9218_003690 [Villophora microphyllina]
MDLYTLPATTYVPPSRLARKHVLNTIIEDEGSERDEGDHSEEEREYAGRGRSRHLQPPRSVESTSPVPSLTSSLSSYPRSHRISRDFEDLYDVSDDESIDDHGLTPSIRCQDMSSRSTSPDESIASSKARSRLPSLIIPSPGCWPTIEKFKNASPPIPMKIPLSPAALSLLPQDFPSASQPPSLISSLLSNQQAPSTAPATPESSHPEVDAPWGQMEMKLKPGRRTTIFEDFELPDHEQLIDNASGWTQDAGIGLRCNTDVRDFACQPTQSLPESPVLGTDDGYPEEGVQLPPEALKTLQHLSLEIPFKPNFDAEESTPVEEMKEVPTRRSRPSSVDWTPASQQSQYSIAQMSIPSPGGFFSSLNANARHTWCVSDSRPPSVAPPSSTTAERFYACPWNQDPTATIERVVEVPEVDTDGPPTARQGPVVPLDQTEEATVVETVVDYDEDYEKTIQEVAEKSLDRTSLWLATQTSYMAALRETNPVNSLGIQAQQEDAKRASHHIRDNSLGSPMKKAVRFLEQETAKQEDMSKITEDSDPIYYHAFQHTANSTRSKDAFQHQRTRADSLQASRICLPHEHVEQLLGKYNLKEVDRPVPLRPISMMPGKDTAEETSEQKVIARVERERQALEQISASMWVVEAARYLHGGNLLNNPAVETLLHKAGDHRILDLGGQPNCGWAWHCSRAYRNAKVYTATTEHELMESTLRGPSNHRRTAVTNLWELPYPDHHFTVISTRSCFQYLKQEKPLGEAIDQYDLCLKECLRCLKPGGYLEFFILDSEIVNAGALGTAASVEFGFNLKTRGYDSAPTKNWLGRVRRAGFDDIKRAWTFLPMGAPQGVTSPLPETPPPDVRTHDKQALEAVQGPVGSTADAANITGLVGGWAWEQWMLKLQIEMGKENLLEGMAGVLEEGKATGAGWRTLNGWARKPLFFKTLVDHEVTVELKNDISIKGTLKSVDQFLNIKLDDIQVLEELKYPHLSSVKNVFIRGSVVRYVHLPGAAVDTALLEDATRRGHANHLIVSTLPQDDAAMFRRPREAAECAIESYPIKSSTGRPPTPPGSIASTTEYSMDTTRTTTLKTPTPLLGRSKTTIRSNGKSPMTAGGKMGGKANGSILSFFKKADPASTKASTRIEDEGLFLDGEGLEEGAGDPIQTPTPPGDFDYEADLPRDARDGSPLDTVFRYNEFDGPVKRRRLSSDRVPIPTSHNAQPDLNVRKGPFVDDSDDEDETTTPVIPEHDHSPFVQPITATSENNADTGPVTERSTSCNSDDATTAAQATTTTIPPLKHEPTSYGDESNNEDIEDFIEDEYPEGEEYMERRWMEEQAELEMGLGDDNEPVVASAIVEEQEKLTGAVEVVQQETMASCPICGGSFGTMSEQDASKHVNDCLDGKAQPLSVASKPIKTEMSAERKPEVPSHKRFQRAAIARPGQENPFDLASTGPGGSSAFSKLMSGHAEDAAWAMAAATEAASRGKPAYQRTCPFYKILPGFSICVDAFRYGAVEGCKAYFLSHFHSDHYIGLTSSWCHGPIYCSHVTANLVRRQLRVDPKWVVDLEFEKKVHVPGTGGVNVTMIPANHCPGSSLYLYEKVVGKGQNPKVQRVLHCGDFRACPAHVQHPLLRPDVIDAVTGKNTAQQKLDVCYLDTTYLTPKYAFPSQEEVIKACADMCVSLSKDKLEENDDWEQMKKERAGSGMVKFIRKDSGMIKDEPDEDGDVKPPIGTDNKRRRGRLLVVVGTYSIGKERICLGVAKALNSKIYATPNKQKICAALEDPELMARLTNDPLEAQVHMQMLMEIRAETLADYLTGYKPHFSRIVGFRPSGWNYRPPNSRFTESPAVQTVLHSEGWKSRYSMSELMPQRGSTREAQCFGVPYSEHSSFRELTMFCCALRIDKIIPTVNVGSAKSRERMKGWCDKWAADKKKNGLFKVADGQTAWS